MQHQLEGPNLCTSYAQLKESFFKVHAEVVDSVESKWRKEAIEFDRLHRRVTVSRGTRLPSWTFVGSSLPSEGSDDLHDLGSARILTAELVNLKEAHNHTCTLAQPVVITRH